jgi:hypothetical protein
MGSMSAMVWNIRLLAFAAMPLAGAIAGALHDERAHLGFTNWRSACRASGLSVSSLIFFTQALLPTAIAGALAGGLVVLLMGFLFRRNRDSARTCVAAHVGCVITMPLGLVLCTLSWPLAVMLVADVALAAACAWLVLRFLRIHSAAYP